MPINTQAFGNTQAHSEENQRDDGSVTHRQGTRISAMEIKRFLEGAQFPADKIDLEEHAKKQGAPHNILDVLKQLPTPEFGSSNDTKLSQYNSLDEVLKEIERLE